jgi:3-hydroxyisobutyrate dehydrogenase-like beta-hydroxyacid dehydrogenase
MNEVSSTSSPIRTVGYIGLGNAGFSMASNLPRHGFHLVVHDADASKAARAAKEWPNTVSASSSADNNKNFSAFRSCDMVITMLPHGKIVREVLLGNSESEGIAKFLKHGTIIVDTSSSSPFDTRALGKELEQSEQGSLRLVDSPITQTYMHATDAGESTLMVGSDSEEVYSRIKTRSSMHGSVYFAHGSFGCRTRNEDAEQLYHGE